MDGDANKPMKKKAVLNGNEDMLDAAALECTR